VQRIQVSKKRGAVMTCCCYAAPAHVDFIENQVVRPSVRGYRRALAGSTPFAAASTLSTVYMSPFVPPRVPSNPANNSALIMPRIKHVHIW